jgi:hypothetical protein
LASLGGLVDLAGKCFVESHRPIHVATHPAIFPRVRHARDRATAATNAAR